MATKLKTRDVNDVEILDAGTWDASTGEVTLTDKELDEMVANTNKLIALGLLAPPVKLGHPKNQKLLQQEGWPAAGWIGVLRREGTKIMSDLKKVPEKLADLIDAGAYRKISSEFWKSGFKIGGKEYAPVLTAVALLGEELPAVSTLDDMVKLFSTGMQPAITRASEGRGAPTFVMLDHASSAKSDQAVEEDLVAAAEKFAEQAAEKTKGKIGAPRLRAFLDEIRRRVKELMADKNDAALAADESLQERTRAIEEAVQKKFGTGLSGYGCWVMATYDDNAIVQKGSEYYRVPYTVDAAGAVQLGQEEPVEQTWQVVTASKAATHSFDVAGGEPIWSEVEQSALPAEAFAIVEDADKRSTWKLPHHFERDGTLHAHVGGIRAALAALSGSTDKATEVPKEARAHLEEHARRAEIGDHKKEEADIVNKELAKLLGLPEDADDAAIHAKTKELVEARTATAATVAELVKDKETRTATELVDTAIRARKLRPAEKPFWVAFAREKPEEFGKYVKEQPALFSAPLGTETDAPDANATEQLNKLANERIAEAAKTGAKLSMRDAILQVTREQPQLARQYRTERMRSSASA